MKIIIFIVRHALIKKIERLEYLWKYEIACVDKIELHVSNWTDVRD